MSRDDAGSVPDAVSVLVSMQVPMLLAAAFTRCVYPVGAGSLVSLLKLSPQKRTAKVLATVVMMAADTDEAEPSDTLVS